MQCSGALTPPLMRPRKLASSWAIRCAYYSRSFYDGRLWQQLTEHLLPVEHNLPRPAKSRCSTRNGMWPGPRA